ncbi:hypothetical protein DL766_003949 [Monosporascus sp. MC13-8B]|uniref:C2H2-type domain-containing protein n=1 Tax=Monosporascus cannonballus TaxID=155416 RepID=A0ABY0HAG9_9PEZI|nr:hypothetical protein DL762_004998 [Monosporascus cannonballus]RYP32461.1 hypothetical protein DL766_003949 [Monosporascus sp. MC13-8B]
MDETRRLRSAREPAGGFSVNGPDLDLVLSRAESLIGATTGEAPSNNIAIDINVFPPSISTPSHFHQPEFHLALTEDGAGALPTPFTPALRANAQVLFPAWQGDNEVMASGSWADVADVMYTSPSYGEDQASSVVSGFSSSGDASVGYNQFSVNNGSLGNGGLNTGVAFDCPDNNNRPMHLAGHNYGWEPGDQPNIPKTPGPDSAFINDTQGSSVSATEVSTTITPITPITNPGEARPAGRRGKTPHRPRCDLCDKDFFSRKDLKRHNRTTKKHSQKNQEHLQLPRPEYTCRCGFSQGRKDNYERHLRTCKLKVKTHSGYICICGLVDRDKGGHERHISMCGKKSPGRPRNHAAGAS